AVVQLLNPRRARLVAVPVAPAVAVGGFHVRAAQHTRGRVGARVGAEQVDRRGPAGDALAGPRRRRQHAVGQRRRLLDRARAHEQAGVPTVRPAGHRVVVVVAPADDFVEIHRFLACVAWPWGTLPRGRGWRRPPSATWRAWLRRVSPRTPAPARPRARTKPATPRRRG